MLGSLHHPGITTLLDGGVSPAGEPYLVMQYVEGTALDRYCDSLRLPVEARLRLFLQVCEAVDYAHRNLVLHRDLKPADILVSLGRWRGGAGSTSVQRLSSRAAARLP